MAPDQKQIVRKRSKVDTQLLIDVLTWFVKESGHPGYTNTSILEDCPQPLSAKDLRARNNTDDPTNKTVETNFEGGTYTNSLEGVRAFPRIFTKICPFVCLFVCPFVPMGSLWG
jgi:hypothetical protein